jgi:hypothetical protein
VEAMRDHAERRLEELKAELAAGQVELEGAERKRLYLHETMLRISGAIQILEELLGAAVLGREDGLAGVKTESQKITPSSLSKEPSN